MSEEKKIDLHELRQLCSGDDAFFEEMIRIFFRTTQESLSAMEKAAAEKNWAAVSDLAHKMRGPVKHLSANTLSGLLMQIENESRDDKQTGHIPELVKQVADETALVTRLIKEETGFWR